jgi:hypothetical protein
MNHCSQLQKILHLARQVHAPGQHAPFLLDAGAAERQPTPGQIFERQQDQGELPAQFLPADCGKQGFRFPLPGLDVGQPLAKYMVSPIPDEYRKIHSG